MSKRAVQKRAMTLTQDEVDTLKNVLRAGKQIVIRSLNGDFKGTEIKELETALNNFGRATTWENEKTLDPKVTYE
jgi:hypothetical protein